MKHDARLRRKVKGFCKRRIVDIAAGNMVTLRIRCRDGRAKTLGDKQNLIAGVPVDVCKLRLGLCVCLIKCLWNGAAQVGVGKLVYLVLCLPAELCAVIEQGLVAVVPDSREKNGLFHGFSPLINF